MSSYPVYVRNLARNFGDRPAIRGVNLEIAQGEFVALIGRSGSGKSTLIRALADLDHDVAGSGTLVVPQNFALVFQDARLLPWKRVLGNVTFGLHGPNIAARTGSLGGGAGKTRPGLAYEHRAASSSVWRWRVPSCESRHFSWPTNLLARLMP